MDVRYSAESAGFGLELMYVDGSGQPLLGNGHSELNMQGYCDHAHFKPYLQSVNNNGNRHVPEALAQTRSMDVASTS